MSWRYLLQRLDGAGGGTWLETDAILGDLELTTAISAPAVVSCKASVAKFPRLASDGLRFFEPWSTALWVEGPDGNPVGGGILAQVGASNTELSLQFVGLSGYLNDMAYTGAKFWVQRDPIDIFREVWAEQQSKPRGNVGLVLDKTLSGQKVGVTLEQVSFDTQAGPVSFESGPWKLAWYADNDIGGRLTSLREATPFDYRERHSWDGDVIRHRLEIGYPTLGARRTDLVFQLGTNLFVNPDSTNDGVDYTDYAVVIGAGEGAAAVSAMVPRSNERRLRRPRMISDKTLSSAKAANARAALEIASSLGEFDVTQVSVRDHSNAPVGSWQDGDQILIDYDVVGQRVQEWVRILSTTIKPQAPDGATLTIERIGGAL